MKPPNDLIICGAGVIGAATAYFLAQRGIAATVVERCGVACAASGKSGGFLALDWCDGTALEPLARKSFALHEQLAHALAADYGYRRLTTLAVTAKAKGAKTARQTHRDFAWLDGSAQVRAVLGTPATTAQVHPEKFTHALLQAAMARGAKLIHGRVQAVLQEDDRVCGVRVDGEVIRATALVIAMGPWSSQIAGLPLPPVSGLKGHSMTLYPDTAIPAQALFLDYQAANGVRHTPEVYPRPDGEVYLCGLSEDSALPENAALVQISPDAKRLLSEVAATLSSSFEGLDAERVQACYRPIYRDGLPLMGRLADVKGAYLATGHSCWGILNAPASGLALAELIVDGYSASVDLTPYDPQRGLFPSAAPRCSAV